MRLLILTLTFAALVLAQTNTGAITGTVLDQQNATVPKAKVIATNLATNVAQNTVSTSSGSYTIPAMMPGRYRVTAEASGFTTLVREPIEVEASSVVTVDLILSVGQVNTKVTVTSEAPLIQQANSTVQYTVNTKQLDELPLANQSVINVLLTMPGVVGSVGSDFATTGGGQVAPGTGISIAGGRAGSTQFLADGVSNTSMYYGRIGVPLSADQTQEVVLLENSYSAEFGRVGAGVVSMTTKSGTNQLHGTLFTFIQNAALNAAPYFNSYQQKGPEKVLRFGFDVGGPVWLPKVYNGRNRTFWFFGFEPLRDKNATSAYYRVPTAAERQGDFSQTRYSIYANYPVTIFQHFTANGQPIVEPAKTPYPQFPGNIIPSQLQSPIGKKILDMMPLPNIPYDASMNNYYYPEHVNNVENRTMFKVDQTISSNDRFSFRAVLDPMAGDRNYLPAEYALADNTMDDVTFATNLALGYTHTWGGNKVNELRLGYNRMNNARRANDECISKDWFSELGFPDILKKGCPHLTIGAASTLDAILGGTFGPPTPGQYFIDDTFQVTDIFSWNKGKHSIKTGFYFLAPQMNQWDVGATNVWGTWAFKSASTTIGTGDTSTYPGIMTANATTGWAAASLLLGYPNNIAMSTSNTQFQYRWKNWAGFFQDDFKVTPRLTANLGLRYQIEKPRTEKNHNQGNYVFQPAVNSQGVPEPGYVQLSGLGGAPDTLLPIRYNNFEPRIAFAYRLPDSLKWLKVIRSGYGISHAPSASFTRLPVPNLNSPSAGNLGPQGGLNGGQIQLDFNPLVLPPPPLTAWPSNGKLVDTQDITSIAIMPQNFSVPYVQQWNFGLGFEFGRSYGLQVSYVGSKGTNLFGPGVNYNTINVNAYASLYTQGYNMSQLIPNPAGIKNAQGNVVAVTLANSLRPQPLLGDISDLYAQGFNSNYNALQAQFMKRFSNGLQFTVNYVFSKSMDDASCDGDQCANSQSFWSLASAQIYGENRKIDYSVSTYDIPHVLKFNYNWDLPIGKGKPILGGARGILNQIVGNWKLSGVGTEQSGVPISATLGVNNGFPDDVYAIRPNINMNVDPYLAGWRQNLNNAYTKTSQYLNMAGLFSPPTLLTLGNSPRTIPYIRAPHRTLYDMSIFKEFPIREQIKAVFRAEMYGALNHPTFNLNTNSGATATVYNSNLNYAVSANPVPTAGTYATAAVNIRVAGQRVIQLGMKLYF